MVFLKRLVFILYLSIFLTLPTFGQDATPLPAFPITPGSYEGNINNFSSSIRYSVALAEGDTVTIRMDNTSGDLDPYLFLFAPDGELITVNDDFEDGNRDAAIEFTAESAGDFTIEATRYDQEIGTTSGTYRLQYEVGGQTQVIEADPLNIAPSFGVGYRFIDYQEYGTGNLSENTPRQYFVLGGDEGDFVRITLTVTGGDLQPTLSVLNESLTVISASVSSSETEAIVYALLPERGWYLIEVGRFVGAGSYDMYVVRFGETVIRSGETLEGEFTRDTPVIAYLFDATINERVFATLAAKDDTVRPEILIFDENLNLLGQREDDDIARVRAIIPRSGRYIVQVSNMNANRGGRFTVNLRQVPQDIDKLNVLQAEYNEGYKGLIGGDNPADYYGFTGKAGELVTVQMDSMDTLDSFIILMDSNFRELAFNDNVGSTRNARITQFPLPEDGEYFIVATRPGLAAGSSIGEYDLELIVGQISLASGLLTATLTWEGEADLNLFVRDPNGRTVSWSTPRIPSGGTLQVDSNTNCQTPTDQPVEHIYWQGGEIPIGDYTIWVWYQNVCMRTMSANFNLSLAYRGNEILTVSPETMVSLAVDERLEVLIRLTGEEALVVDAGTISRPSAQQRASQGGDPLIRYGQEITGTINNDVYALFYQFAGNEGDDISIQAEQQTGNLDPILVLRDAADRNLVTNDDTPDSQNSRIDYTLPADGQYIIAVTRFGLRDGTTIGDFRLALDKNN